MKRTALATASPLVLCLLCLSGFAQQKSRAANPTEQVWAGEQAYWRYVKAHDVTRYLALWSDDFAGWPIVNEPSRTQGRSWRVRKGKRQSGSRGGLRPSP